MKLIVEEYGRIMITVILGGFLFVFINGTFLDAIREQIDFPDSIEKESNQQNAFYRVPELEGLEKDGIPLALKIHTGERFNPVGTEGIIQVKATDELDGDITDQIKVYLVETENGKEKQTLIQGNLDTSEANRQFILEYRVENSAGYQTKKRISVLTDGTGGTV